MTLQHAVAVLGVVLEQRVCPSGAATFLVDRVRRGRSRTTPDGGAPGRVGDEHAVAEQLGDEARVGGFGAARAGAGELEQRLLELTALHGVVLDLGLVGHLLHAVVEHVLLGELALGADHGKRVGGAHADAHAAAHAVERRDGEGVAIGVLELALHRNDNKVLRRRGDFLVGERIGADRGVRAHERTLVALDARGGFPLGNAYRNAALLERRRTLLELAVLVTDERGDGQRVAVHAADGLHDLAHLLDELWLALKLGGSRVARGVRPIGGNVDLHERGRAGVDRLVVHVDDGLSLLQVRFRSRILHVLDGLGLREHTGKREERRLQDGVRALAHADLDSQINCVDRVELHVIFRDVALGVGGQVVRKLLGRPLAVDHEGAARLHVLHDGEVLRDVAGVMASNEVRLINIVGAADRAVAEAEMRNRHAARLLGVVLEVGLHILVGVVADDLDGVLVRADRAVAAQAPELALDSPRRRGVRTVGVLRQREVGHVIDDTDGELAARLVLRKLGEHSERGCGRGVLRAQAVAAADDGDTRAALNGERVQNVHVQRLADAARLLRAIEHGDLLHRLGKRRYELARHERTVQAHLHKAHLLAVGVEVVDDLLGHVAERAHGNDHAVGVGRAVVVEQLVVGAELGVDLVHIVLHDGRKLVVEGVARLAVLEEDVAVLVRATHGGALRVERVVAERLHRVHVAHIGKIGIIPACDLLDLMRSAEAVEEVQKRDATLDGRQVRHRSQVHDFLHVALGEHGEAGLAAGHDVGVVAEDVERVGGNATRGDVEHARQALASDLVHVRDHEQQALGRRVGRREGAGAKGAVDGAGGASLRLHLDHIDGGAKDVLQTLRGPLIDVVGHRAGRRDRVDARHLGVGVRDPSSSLVAVHRLELTCHILSFLSRSRVGLARRAALRPPWRMPKHAKSPRGDFPDRQGVTSLHSELIIPQMSTE